MGSVGKFALGIALTAVGAGLMFINPAVSAGMLTFIHGAGLSMVWAGTGLLLKEIIGIEEQNAALRGTVTGTQNPLPVIYGERVKVGGILVDARETVQGTGESLTEYLHCVYALSVTSDIGQGIQGVDQIELGPDVVATDLLVGSYSATGQTQGVTIKAQDPDGNKLLWYNIHVGSNADNAVDPMMDNYCGSTWLSSMTGDGIAYVATRWKFHPETFTNVPTNNVSFIVNGNKVKDFRDDSTVFTTNPVLQLYDYLTSNRYGPSIPASEIDTGVGSTWNTAASYAEASVTGNRLNYTGGGLYTTQDTATNIYCRPTSSKAMELWRYIYHAGAGSYGLDIVAADNPSNEGSYTIASAQKDGSYTGFWLVLASGNVPLRDNNLHFQQTDTSISIPRFESSGPLFTSDTHATNIDKLLAAMRGTLYWQDGQYKLWIRQSDTPHATKLNADNTLNEVVITRSGVEQTPNTVIAKFVNPNKNYEVDELAWPYFGSSNTYLTNDNDFDSIINIDLHMVNRFDHAADIAEVTLKELRQDVTVKVIATEEALKYEIGDIVQYTNADAGWTDKEFWVTALEILPNGNVELTLREYDTAVYTISGVPDEEDVPGTSLPDPFSIAPPTNVSANCAAGYYLKDGVFVPRVEVTWTSSVSANLAYEELLYKKNAASDWQYTGAIVPVGETAAASWEDDLELEEDYDFGVVAWNTRGIQSTIASTASPCTITGPSDTPTDVSITDSDITCLEGITLEWDNPSPYTAANSIGVKEIQFWTTEIREQGAGATELDRWNNGTYLGETHGTRWNLPFDQLTQGSYDLTLRRFDRFGKPNTTPTETTLTLSAWPCTGFGTFDPEEFGSIINNGDFEKQFAYWYSTAAARTSMESVSPIGGSYSLKITADGAVDTDVKQTNDPANDETSGGSDLKLVPTHPNESWVVSGSAYTSSTNEFQVYVQFYDEDKVATSGTVAVSWTDNTATDRSGYFRVPTGSYYFNIVLRSKLGSGDCYVDQLAAVPFDTIPVAFYDITHNGDGTATVVVRVYDLSSRVTDFDVRTFDVDSQTWGAWVDDSDPSVTVTPYNSYTTDYEWDVTLHEKHDTYTEYQVTYVVIRIPGAGTPYFTAAYLRQVLTIDVDTVPEFVSFNLNVDDSGNCELHWGLDDDGNSIKYTKSTISYADAGDPTGGTALNGTSNQATIHTGLAFGDTLYVRAIPYTGATGTGDAGTREAKDRVTNLGGAIYPTVQEQLSYSGSNGVVDLVINDPDSRVTLVEFNTKSGLGAWSGWASDTAPYQATVALTEKHDSHISWRVTFTNLAAGSSLIEGSATFDVDQNPEFVTLTMDVDESGNVELSWGLDDDGLSIKYTKSTVSYAAAGDPTGGTALDGRNDVAQIHTGLAYGDTLYVRAIPYTGANGTGSAGSQEGTVKVTQTSDVYGTPADVTGFTNFVISKGMTGYVLLKWNIVTTPGVTGYEIRYGGTGWSDATYQADTTSNYYRILFGDAGFPSGTRTYRIKAKNTIASPPLESANAANTTVNFTGRPSGAACSMYYGYGRGCGLLTGWNLSASAGTIFRFHWGLTSGFTPSTDNALAIYNIENPTATEKIGLSLCDSGWTDDNGRTVYIKVGVKDGLSDELGEGWSYSSGYSATLNPFETIWIKETLAREFINGNYTDASRRPTTLRKTSGDLSADNAFDKTVDTYTTIGAQKQVTYAPSAPGSPTTGEIWVDTDATPVSINRWTGSVWSKIGNLTEGALALLNQVDTSEIANGAITDTKIENGAVTTDKIYANAVTAAKIASKTITAAEIYGTTLSTIFADVGVLNAGIVQNSGGQNQIILSGTPTGSRYIDLTSTSGNDYFIYGGSNFWVQADGDAYFGGEVGSSSFTATTASFEKVEIDSGLGFSKTKIGSSSFANTIVFNYMLPVSPYWQANCGLEAVNASSGGVCDIGFYTDNLSSERFRVTRNQAISSYGARVYGNLQIDGQTQSSGVLTVGTGVSSGTIMRWETSGDTDSMIMYFTSNRMIFVPEPAGSSDWNKEFYFDFGATVPCWRFDASLWVNTAQTGGASDHEGVLKIMNRTGDPATPASGVYLYAKSGELWVKDGGGTPTQLS